MGQLFMETLLQETDLALKESDMNTKTSMADKLYEVLTTTSGFSNELRPSPRDSGMQKAWRSSEGTRQPAKLVTAFDYLLPQIERAQPPS